MNIENYLRAVLLNQLAAVSFFYLLGCSPCFSQHNFKTYTIEDGLSQSQVYAICEDSRGNLWLGTYGGGVCKYDGRSFTHFTTKDGLGNNVVYAIIEDLSGNLWFATDGGGVTVYDGANFTQYTEENGLGSDHVYSIAEDAMGNIWLGTHGGGISKYEPSASLKATGDKGSTFPKGRTFIIIDTANGLSSNNIMTLTEDNKGDLFIGTDNGVCMLDKKNNWKYFTTANGLSDNRVYSILEDHNGNIWFGTFGGGISILLKRTNLGFDTHGMSSKEQQWKYINTKDGLCDNRVTSLFEDRDGNIWFGTYGGGLCKLALDKADISYQYSTSSLHFTHFTEKDGLSNNIIWSILQDRSGNLWFGTEGGGLIKYMGEIFTHFTINDGLRSNIVFSIKEDRSGNLWFGTNQGISRLRAEDKTSGIQWITGISAAAGLIDENIITMMEDRAGKIWIGTNEGVSVGVGATARVAPTFSHFNLEQLNAHTILSIYEDRKGNIWFGTDPAGVVRYDPATYGMLQYTVKEGLNNDIVWSILEDSSGNIWLGTWGGGVSKLTPLEREEARYKIENITEHEGLSNNFVLTILEDTAGNLWFGTYGGGISILKNANALNSKPGKSSDWAYINTTYGLSDDGVVSMTFDAHGSLWAGTNKGINRISNIGQGMSNARLFNIRQYGKLEGFVGIECNQNAICKDSKGNIWFGTANVLTKYNPRTDKINLVEPQSHITGLRLFFEKVDWKEYADSVSEYYPVPVNLTLPYDKNHITFDFIGISLKIPEKVKYQYMLKGLDDDWLPPVKENFATYPGVPPGDYTFMVRACNNDGIWNKEPVTYSFSIAPPFWQTWWFYLLCAFTGMSGLFGGYRWRIRNLKREKQKLQKMVKERTIELRQAYVNLKKLEKFKESMMGMIVHDLKNPLNVILGFSKYKPSGKILENIYHAGKQMLNLVMNILDVQRFEDTEVKLNLSVYPVKSALDEALQQVEVLVKQKGLLIENNINNDIISKFDFENISRVLVNLLTNAIKYTPSGGKITINAVVVETRPGLVSTKNQMVEVSVSDTGAGIPEDMLKTVFDRFSQIQSKDAGHTGSTGLGLTFCKFAVEAHGGQIWVESEAGKGATFYFTLPDATTQPLSPQTRKGWVKSAGAPLPFGKGQGDGLFTILVVDDEEFNRQIIIDILQQAKKQYSVMIADSGKIACEMAGKLSPGLILMDWMMPEMTGLDTLIRLKAQLKTKHIPVIMVTGVTAPEKLRDAFEVGMEDYISKPVNALELLTKIEVLTKREIS